MFGQPSFLGMVRLIEYASVHLPMEEVAVHAGREVLMEVDDNILLIVGDPQGISVEQLRPHPNHFQYNFIIIILKYF